MSRWLVGSSRISSCGGCVAAEHAGEPGAQHLAAAQQSPRVCSAASARNMKRASAARQAFSSACGLRRRKLSRMRQRGIEQADASGRAARRRTMIRTVPDAGASSPVSRREQGRLARTVGPGDGDALRAGDRQGEVADHRLARDVAAGQIRRPAARSRRRAGRSAAASRTAAAGSRSWRAPRLACSAASSRRRFGQARIARRWCSRLRSFMPPSRIVGCRLLAALRAPAPSLRALRSAFAWACGRLSASLALGVGQVVLGRRKFERLALAIVAPVAAIARRAERGQLDDGVHRLAAVRGRG